VASGVVEDGLVAAGVTAAGGGDVATPGTAGIGIGVSGAAGVGTGTGVPVLAGGVFEAGELDGETASGAGPGVGAGTVTGGAGGDTTGLSVSVGLDRGAVGLSGLRCRLAMPVSSECPPAAAARTSAGSDATSGRVGSRRAGAGKVPPMSPGIRRRREPGTGSADETLILIGRSAEVTVGGVSAAACFGPTGVIKISGRQR
jgi:hypothetical protein